MTSKTTRTAQKKRVFKQLSNVEHVRLRTGMWLGQNSLAHYDQHFFTPSANGKVKIHFEELSEIPAKLKCLDEVCMNAVDEYSRNQSDVSLSSHQRMTTLHITLHNGGKRITVWDNGRGIPAANAEAVFLHLMYGENFDDTARQEHVAGQNGVGVSLVRIVSKYFYVESFHGGKYYSKLFTPHPHFIKMLDQLELSPALKKAMIKQLEERGSFTELSSFRKLTPTVQRTLINEFKKTGMASCLEVLSKSKRKTTAPAAASARTHGTNVSFELDERYFNYLEMSFSKRLLRQYLSDLAMTNPGLRVQLTLEPASQQSSAQEEVFYYKKGLEELLSRSELVYYKLLHEDKTLGLKLEAFVVAGEGRTLSWINGNFATLGGSPIEYFNNRICDEVRKKPSIVQAEKRLKTAVTRADVRKFFHVYHVIKLRAPRFKSQDKSYLINDLNIPIRQAVEEHLERLSKKLKLLPNIIAECERRTRLQQLDNASKEVRRTTRTVVEKLVPCSSKSHPNERTLFLGEGDSAIAGLRSVRNPIIHALFPLRGKPLNVKGLTLGRVLQNEEFKNIVAIVGLPLDGKQTLLETLHYQKICIVTDADYDGYAIRSLLLNFFFEYWPELFKLGCIHLVEAPLYEVKLINPNKVTEQFYCINDAEFAALMIKAKQQSCTLLRKKRNKGLGETSPAAMAYAIEHNLLAVKLEHPIHSRNVQKIWFAKTEAAQRRKEISAYAQRFFEE